MANPVLNPNPTVLLDVEVKANEPWLGHFFFYDAHKIKSLTPGAAITTVVTYDAHNITNGANVRMVVSDGLNTNCISLFVATVLTATSFTIPKVGVAATSNSGYCGAPTDISGTSFKSDFVDPSTNTKIVSLAFTIIDGPNGAFDASLTGAQTGAITQTALVYDLWQTIGTNSYKKCEGNVLVIPSITTL